MTVAQTTLRVAHVTRSLDRGGAESFVTSLLPRLAASGIECAVFTLGPRGVLAADLERSGVAVHEIALRRFYDPRRLGSALRSHSLDRAAISLDYRVRQLTPALAEYAPALVHTHLLEADVVGVLAASALRLPCVSTQHDMFTPEDNLGTHDRFLFERKCELASAFDAVCAISAPVADYAEQRIGVARDHIRIVAPGVDLGRFGEVALPPSAGVFGVIGGLHPWKGQSVAIEAFARVVRDHPAAELRIAGAGPTRAELEALTERLGLGGRVRFLGEVSAPEGFFAAVDVALVPSLSEGFGRVAVEAMAAGRPVVASRVGGLADVVEDGVAGLLVEPGDAEQLADAMSQLLRDPAAGARMGRAGRSAAEKYAIERTAAEYAEIYRAVLAARGARS